MQIRNAQKLESVLPDEFHKRLLGASLQSLSDTGNPLSYANFCNGFRELIRHVFSRLAPDHEITQCPWYVPDTTSKTGITRGHAISYILHGGLRPDYVAMQLGIDHNAEKKQLLSAIAALNKYVHVNPGTFEISLVDAETGANGAIDSLIAVLKLAEDCQAKLANTLHGHIHEEVIHSAISETIISVDELSTHHCVEEVYVHESRVVRIDSKYVHVKAFGEIGVELQWGSNGDLRRGDGATLDECFPFECSIVALVTPGGDFEVEDVSLSVDTSSWWESSYDET